MKSLVVFYSRTGNTKKLAKSINELLKNEIEEIIDTKKRKGALGFFIGGKDASQKKLTKIKDIKKDPLKYELILIGTPIWMGRMCPAIRTYICKNKDKFKNVAFFCTMGSEGNKEKFIDMEESCGKKPIATLELRTKEVADKEYKKVKEFIKKLVS
ncbi:MAG: flavodoxin family protein [Candidatus Woesearchaeota archaeon]|nr:MAG: flavodoxin family protein [Candidatus Woesearchaeota archaeon]